MAFDASRLGRLIRKELSEILRDRRTIITLVLMPILLYPLLSVAFQQFFLASRLAPDQGIEYHLGFVSEDDEKLFTERLVLGDRVLASRQATADSKGKKAGSAPTAKGITGSFDELAAEVHAGKLDVVIRRVPSAARLPAESYVSLNFEIHFLPTSPGGQGAVSFIEQRLAAANEVELVRVLRHLKNNKQDISSRVVRLAKTPLEEAGGGAFISLASLVPLILILMTITGAVYPAIDLTAGERERGTLEILVSAPVPRLGLLFAKYVSVVTVAILTALVNLIAMTGTLVFSGLGAALFPNQGLSFGIIFLVFCLLLLFAAFFSAVLLCITSFARSFKEAQAYLIPLMLVSLAPGVMGMVPGLKLASWAAAPLVNIVLLARDLFEGKAEPGPALMVVAATLVYAGAAIALAARIFGDESVLYNEQTGWGDLFRRPEEPQAVAHVSVALWCLALMIPLNFLIQGSLYLLESSKILDDQLLVFLAPLQSILVFGALPAVFAWRGHLCWSTAYALGRARWPAYVGGIALGFSVWPLVFVIMSWLGAGSSDLPENDRIQQLVELYRSLPTSLRVLLVIIPAALEEWLFRGFLFGAIRNRLSGVGTIVTTAALFGAAHYVFEQKLGQQIGMNRMLSSFIMGLLLGAVRETSGSVWPGTLLHMVHNTILALLIEQDTGQLTTIEPWWVAGGAIGATVGVCLIWLGRDANAFRKRKSKIGEATL